jgi:hypothetical protein
MDVYLSTVSNRLKCGDEAAGGDRDDLPALAGSIGGWETFVGLGVGTELRGARDPARHLQAAGLVLR